MTEKDALEKKVDEEWKGRAEKEKFSSKEEIMPPEAEAEADFGSFISGLGMQALIALGEIPNPLTKKKEKELRQAKYIIDIICLLREKARGNLTTQENDLINDLIYELQMKYVTASQG